MLHNIVLVSAVQWSESAICTYPLPLFLKYVFFLNWRIIALQCCCRFLPHITMNRPQVHICPLPLKPPPPHPNPVPRAELPALFSCFPLAISLTHCSVDMSVLRSQLVPPSPFPSVSTSLFSTSASLFLTCK